MVDRIQPPAWEATHRRLTLMLQFLITAGFLLEIYEGHWMNAVLVAGILLLTIAPRFLSRGLGVFIPPEFELFTIAFVFASLYLGERRDYYARFWWWDLALHATSGGLLGILGFLLVYILNANPRIALQMRPSFLALFAFSFSLAIGALWEIFEFGMDQIFGMNMQKPMLNDPSGLTDTMWDLIVDAIGAFAMSAYGWMYVHQGRKTIVSVWINRFIISNPALFPPEAARDQNAG